MLAGKLTDRPRLLKAVAAYAFDVFWTMERHCSTPSVLSPPARAFVLFIMFVGEAMDRPAYAPAAWVTPFNSPAEAVAFNASLAADAALLASSDDDDDGNGDGGGGNADADDEAAGNGGGRWRGSDGDQGGGRVRKAVAFSGDVVEALPPDMWLLILSFLRLNELRFALPELRFALPALGHGGGGGGGGGAAAPAPPQGRILAKARRKGGNGRA